MDLEGRRVSRGGEAIDLTSREFSILEYFLRNQNRLITRATMADQI
jgi:DNA-binding response OmpR family regulator